MNYTSSVPYTYFGGNDSTIKYTQNSNNEAVQDKIHPPSQGTALLKSETIPSTFPPHTFIIFGQYSMVKFLVKEFYHQYKTRFIKKYFNTKLKFMKNKKNNHGEIKELSKVLPSLPMISDKIKNHHKKMNNGVDVSRNDEITLSSENRDNNSNNSLVSNPPNPPLVNSNTSSKMMEEIKEVVKPPLPPNPMTIKYKSLNDLLAKKYDSEFESDRQNSENKPNEFVLEKEENEKALDFNNLGLSHEKKLDSNEPFEKSKDQQQQQLKRNVFEKKEEKIKRINDSLYQEANINIQDIMKARQQNEIILHKDQPLIVEKTSESLSTQEKIRQEIYKDKDHHLFNEKNNYVNDDDDDDDEIEISHVPMNFNKLALQLDALLSQNAMINQSFKKPSEKEEEKEKNEEEKSKKENKKGKEDKEHGKENKDRMNDEEETEKEDQKEVEAKQDESIMTFIEGDIKNVKIKDQTKEETNEINMVDHVKEENIHQNVKVNCNDDHTAAEDLSHHEELDCLKNHENSPPSQDAFEEEEEEKECEKNLDFIEKDNEFVLSSDENLIHKDSQETKKENPGFIEKDNEFVLSSDENLIHKDSQETKEEEKEKDLIPFLSESNHHPINFSCFDFPAVVDEASSPFKNLESQDYNNTLLKRHKTENNLDRMMNTNSFDDEHLPDSLANELIAALSFDHELGNDIGNEFLNGDDQAFFNQLSHSVSYYPSPPSPLSLPLSTELDELKEGSSSSKEKNHELDSINKVNQIDRENEEVSLITTKIKKEEEKNNSITSQEKETLKGKINTNLSQSTNHSIPLQHSTSTSEITTTIPMPSDPVNTTTITEPPLVTSISKHDQLMLDNLRLQLTQSRETCYHFGIFLLLAYQCYPLNKGRHVLYWLKLNDSLMTWTHELQGWYKQMEMQLSKNHVVTLNSIDDQNIVDHDEEEKESTGRMNHDARILCQKLRYINMVIQEVQIQLSFFYDEFVHHVNTVASHSMTTSLSSKEDKPSSLDKKDFLLLKQDEDTKEELQQKYEQLWKNIQSLQHEFEDTHYVMEAVFHSQQEDKSAWQALKERQRQLEYEHQQILLKQKHEREKNALSDSSIRVFEEGTIIDMDTEERVYETVVGADEPEQKRPHSKLTRAERIVIQKRKREEEKKRREKLNQTLSMMSELKAVLTEREKSVKENVRHQVQIKLPQ
ncbi:hypothetical protein BCR36DRAFT_350907 [Piromyces finnis]|uniref:Uncharacterized protein n=1 Tax=Piromyces finnis TaxID=1754191 RepID=A0A1Y1VCM6_9FUNG|nr:hypothetical protein BCR36DRAFT_350907 [Piromyces finnis]|eukprot:ORX51858.1 hypothetical protein BCR36DRAFT_350907 [Piromyces finnis]